jgi:hypothetical protein
MPKPTRSTAFHEAGHAVTAAVLGLETEKVSIEPSADDAGCHKLADAEYERVSSAERVFAQLEMPGFDGCRFEAKEEADQLLRRHMMVVQAGEEAQRRAVPASFRHHHVRAGDHGRIIDLALRLTGGNSDAVEALDQDIRSETKRLLDEHWRAVEAVAEALLERRTLSGAEVQRLVTAAK